MGVTYPTMWNGMYLGNMSEQQAELIMQTRSSEKIENLKHMVFDFPPELIKRSLDEGISIREMAKTDESIDLKQYVSELRDYQTVGTAFMYLSPRSIIADGCGLGKTVEVSALINYLKSTGVLTRFLIAVESGALGQTQCELERFTGLNVVAMPSEAPKIRRVIKKTDWRKVDGIVIKHSTLRSDPFSQWLALNLDENGLCKIFNTFFLDESSLIKNNKTKTYEYTRNICNIVTRVHFMNATAFETNIMDVYNQLDMIEAELLPKQWRIEKDYCVHKKSQYWTKVNGKAQLNFRRERTGYKDQAKFKKSLQLVYFGRSSKEIFGEVPNVYKTYYVTPTNDMAVALEKGYRYNELLNCPSLIPDVGIGMTRKEVPKLDRLCKLIETEFSDVPVMVYCFHREAQAAIERELRAIGRKPVVLNGEITDSMEKYSIQQKFNNGEYDVIITNIKKSLNLNAAQVCIFYSMETNIAKMEQTARRIDRHVDDSIRTFILLLYEHTAECDFFMNTVAQRAKDARDLTIDAKTAVDYFVEAMRSDEAGQ